MVKILCLCGKYAENDKEAHITCLNCKEVYHKSCYFTPLSSTNEFCCLNCHLIYWKKYFLQKGKL